MLDEIFFSQKTNLSILSFFYTNFLGCNKSEDSLDLLRKYSQDYTYLRFSWIIDFKIGNFLIYILKCKFFTFNRKIWLVFV